MQQQDRQPAQQRNGSQPAAACVEPRRSHVVPSAGRWLDQDVAHTCPGVTAEPAGLITPKPHHTPVSHSHQ